MSDPSNATARLRPIAATQSGRDKVTKSFIKFKFVVVFLKLLASP